MERLTEHERQHMAWYLTGMIYRSTEDRSKISHPDDDREALVPGGGSGRETDTKDMKGTGRVILDQMIAIEIIGEANIMIETSTDNSNQYMGRQRKPTSTTFELVFIFKAVVASFSLLLYFS